MNLILAGMILNAPSVHPQHRPFITMIATNFILTRALNGIFVLADYIDGRAILLAVLTGIINNPATRT